MNFSGSNIFRLDFKIEFLFLTKHIIIRRDVLLAIHNLTICLSLAHRSLKVDKPVAFLKL